MHAKRNEYRCTLINVDVDTHNKKKVILMLQRYYFQRISSFKRDIDAD